MYIRVSELCEQDYQSHRNMGIYEDTLLFILYDIFFHLLRRDAGTKQDSRYTPVCIKLSDLLNAHSIVC